MADEIPVAEEEKERTYMKLLKREEQDIRDVLEKEDARIDQRLKTLSSEDPFLQEDRTYSHELAQDATDTAGHDRVVALTHELKRHKEAIAHALQKLEAGTYGICESCNAEIGIDRLRIMPMATMCLACEQKLEQG